MQTYKAQGVRATDHYLTVYVTVEAGLTVRFAEIKVPMFMLVTDQVAGALAAELRRQQLEVAAEADVPLFVE